MKKYGSSYSDSLFGTSAADNIFGDSGNDLIATNGGRDQIEAGGGNDLVNGISFNLNSVSSSSSYGATIDGGSGRDTLVIELSAAKGTSYVEHGSAGLNINNVEDIIYSFSGLSKEQNVEGSRNSETICLGDSSVNANGMDGSDYLFSGAGSDNLQGGAGNDFISAGDGNNVVTGGSGADSFHFYFNGANQYTEITDFKAGTDKIAISIDHEQYNLFHGTSLVATSPDRSYGDGVQITGLAINTFVSGDSGRYFDSKDFHFSNNDFNNFAIYDRSTGSVLVKYYVDVNSVIQEHDILVAHVDGHPKLDVSDFGFDLF
jgi:Ca2+-binding RTX toxin-like protein